MRLLKKSGIARFGAAMIAMALLSGCSTKRIDISSGAETATIKDTLYGPTITECRITLEDSAQRTSQLRPTELTVDAGRTLIVAECPHPMGGLRVTPFLFFAKSGHVYELRRERKGTNCLELVDTTLEDEKVISCEPYWWGGYAHYSSGTDVAVVVGVRQRGWSCGIRTDEGARAFRRVQIDPNKVSIEAECRYGIAENGSSLLSQEQFTGRSRFDFVPEANHTYEIRGSKENCIRLVDTTDEEMPLMCNPLQKVE